MKPKIRNVQFEIKKMLTPAAKQFRRENHLLFFGIEFFGKRIFILAKIISNPFAKNTIKIEIKCNYFTTKLVFFISIKFGGKIMYFFFQI